MLVSVGCVHTAWDKPWSVTDRVWLCRAVLCCWLASVCRRWWRWACLLGLPVSHWTAWSVWGCPSNTMACASRGRCGVCCLTCCSECGWLAGWLPALLAVNCQVRACLTWRMCVPLLVSRCALAACVGPAPPALCCVAPCLPPCLAPSHSTLRCCPLPCARAMRPTAPQ